MGVIDLGTQLMSDPGIIPAYSNMCFIPGLDELLVVEASGYARIFSLAMQQFKWADCFLTTILTSFINVEAGLSI